MSLRAAFAVVALCLLSCSSILDGGMPAGGASAGSGGGASGGGSSQSDSCNMPGTTQSCCESGTRTCAGNAEFPTWTPCRDASGTVLSCCIPGEFTTCDGGVPSQPDAGCTPGEFLMCDGGMPVLPPMPMLCQAGGANNEPEILIGYAPASGQTVGSGGQIKVWINDEGAPIIAPGEIVDANTGAITTPGDRTAKAPDGYLWEPALYIAPQSAENGGTPHFPTAIKGYYNNTLNKGPGTLVAGMDPPPPGNMPLQEIYTSEDIWDVSSLGLPPGTYIGEFVIHDGDEDRGVGCVTIVITATQ